MKNIVGTLHKILKFQKRQLPNYNFGLWNCFKLRVQEWNLETFLISYLLFKGKDESNFTSTTSLFQRSCKSMLTVFVLKIWCSQFLKFLVLPLLPFWLLYFTRQISSSWSSRLQWDFQQMAARGIWIINEVHLTLWYLSSKQLIHGCVKSQFEVRVTSQFLLFELNRIRICFILFGNSF